jgi:tetratricopeptide (TPR) repeat protein
MATKRDWASEHNERARELDDKGRTEDAIREYLRACEIDPQWSVPHYNLGLVYKYAGDWEKSLHWNRRATELDPSHQASWWNLGIAATALGRWDEAAA